MSLKIKTNRHAELELNARQEELSKSNGLSYDNNNTMSILSSYYGKTDNKFLSKIDKLNITFLVLSDKYLKQQNEINKVKDSLFINLFKQISLYVEEIERLNKKIIEKEGTAKSFKELTFSEMKKEISTSKCLIRNLENKLISKIESEERLKQEIASYKRQITFYKDKLKLELLNVKSAKKNLKSPSKEKDRSSLKRSTSTSAKKTSHYITVTTKDQRKNKMNIANTQKTQKKTLNFSLTSRSESGKVRVTTIFKRRKINRSMQIQNELSTFHSFTKSNSHISEGDLRLSRKESGKLKLVEELGELVKSDLDKEIRMLTDQENEIAKMLKIIGYNNNNNNNNNCSTISKKK